MDTTQWIRSQAASGMPLNLNAVRRVRPDLLESAFAGPSSRGWRRTLLDAGVDPYQIIHEHETEVACAVCGVSGAVLGSHIRGCHGMTGEEYLQEFGPDCELSSESFRAARFTVTPISGIAHWEGLWSRYYVIDWIIRLHEEAHDLNYHAVVKYGRTLAVAALRLVGSWDAALLAAGLDPAVERLHPPGIQWTPELVLERLREFETAKRERPRLELPDGLRIAVRRNFGTLETACRAAGLQLSDISSRAIYSSRQVTDLVEAVLRLENLKGLERRRRLDEICHKSEDAQRIIKFHFGSLRKLAIRHGIDSRVVADTIYRDEADVQHDLDMLERAGMASQISRENPT